MAEDLLSWHSAWRRSKASAGGGRDWEPEVGALEVRPVGSQGGQSYPGVLGGGGEASPVKAREKASNEAQG